jgi:hypothetical protein
MTLPHSLAWTRRIRPLRRPGAIPSPDLAALAAAARRTRLVRLALGIALVALVAAAFFLVRGLEVRRGGFLPVGSTDVIVVDLSTSVGSESNRRIARVLSEFVESDEPAGLVLFSDAAYELVPPGTPGVELKPLLRFFTPRRLTPEERERLRLEGRLDRDSDFLQNPWMSAFRGGTRISAGLQVARRMLRRDRVTHGAVLLVSDLDYSPFDLTDLTETLVQYRREGLPIRVVPLFPSSPDREFFERLIGKGGIVEWNELRASGRTRQAKQGLDGSMPLALLTVGVLVIGLLALNELSCGRLAIQSRGERR